MDRKFLVILFGAAALAMPALAQQGASFNGTWTLDNAKSSFGQFPPPQSETDTIQVNGSDFQQHVTSVTARGTQDYTRECTLDGKEVTFAPDDPKAQLMPGLKLSKIQCGWDGNSVFVLETRSLSGRDPHGQDDVFSRRLDAHHDGAYRLRHHEWRPDLRL